MTPEALLYLLRPVAPHPAAMPVPQPQPLSGLPLAILVLPVDPDVLVRSIQSSMGEGRADSLTYRFAMLVPAGNTVRVPLYVPEGYVGIATRSWRISTSLHDRDIVAYVYIDAVKSITPEGIPLSQDKEVWIGNYRFIHDNITVQVVNASTQDATVTVDADVTVVEESLFDTYIKPILSYSSRVMDRVAEAARRGAV